MKRLSCLLSLVWLVGALGVHAQAPADSNIKAALADIEKFERQFAGSSANPNSVRRTLKLLGLTRPRRLLPWHRLRQKPPPLRSR